MVTQNFLNGIHWFLNRSGLDFFVYFMLPVAV